MDENPPTRPPPNAFLEAVRAHRFYGAAVGYLVAAWIVLQVAAIVLPGFGAPPWVLRALMMLLALGLGLTLLAVWGRERRAWGLAWTLAALLPAALVTAFFLLHPLRGTARAPTAALVDKSVAVLPFENLSTDKDNAFFADGVQDEVLTDLAKVADLKVISRTSVMQYHDANRNLPDIARALGVAYVVEGSVQRAGNKIRVVAQLIDARTDAHRWAEHYDRDLADVFAIQSEIAQNIAAQLQAAISPQEHAAITEVPTHDDQAYQLFLRANALWNEIQGGDFGSAKTILPEAAALLQQATARDPGFVRAFVLWVEVDCYRFFNEERTPEIADDAHRAAETVARLRPGSPDALLVTGAYDYYVRRDDARAYEEFAEVVRRSPNDSRAVYLLGCIERRRGNWDDALMHLRRAMELDPEDDGNFSVYVEVLDGLKRYPEEEAALDRRLAAHPQQHAWRLAKAWIPGFWKADTRAARAELARLPPEFDPGGAVTDYKIICDEADRDFAAAARDLAACPLAEINYLPRGVFEGEIAAYRGDARAALAFRAAARPIQAETVRAQPDNPHALMSLALLDADLGEKALALDEGRRAVAAEPAGDFRERVMMGNLWAELLAHAGEREQAIAALQAVCGKPYGPNYGWLHANPEWDALRGDTRFGVLVASLAPKP